MNRMVRRLERRRRRTHVYGGFGFPVILTNVLMVRVRGAWTPDVDYDALERRVLAALARKPTRLTGAEVRFIRHSFSMTLEEFARRFGVTHPAVMAWETTGQRATAMSWALEKDIRLEQIRRAAGRNPAPFVSAYRSLEAKPSAGPHRIRVDFARSA